MKLLDYELGLDNTLRALIEGESNNVYTTNINFKTSTTWCSCPSWVFNKDCKHIKFLFDNIDLKDIKMGIIENEEKDLGSLKSGCETVDALLDDGFPIGIVSTIFGKPKLGKSRLSTQVALATMKEGYNVLVIETEGYRRKDYLRILTSMKDRFDLTEDEINKKLKYVSLIGANKEAPIKKLCKILGMDLLIKRSEIKTTKAGKVISGGKMQIYTPNSKDYKGIDDSDMKGVKLIILDSISHPIKALIGSKTENLPERATLFDRIFGKLYHYANKYEAAVIVIQHASVNPITIGYTDHGKQWGGDSPYYNSKYGIQLHKPDKTAREKFGGEEARRVRAYIHPFIKTPTELYPVALRDNWGFDDNA